MTPVITHPERNPILRENLQRVVEWAEQGCVVQVTGSSFTGFWGEKTLRAATWLLEHQAVHVLATDAHEMQKRIPILSTARDAARQSVAPKSPKRSWKTILAPLSRTSRSRTFRARFNQLQEEREITPFSLAAI